MMAKVFRSLRHDFPNDHVNILSKWKYSTFLFSSTYTFLITLLCLWWRRRII